MPQGTRLEIDNFRAELISPTERQFIRITNTGLYPISGLKVTKDGANASDFAVRLPYAQTLAPGARTNLEVVFAPSASGLRTASLHILSSLEGGANPFDILLKGKGLTALENWRKANFGSSENSGTAADLFDFDNDGLVNLLEFACHTNPSGSGTFPAWTNLNGSNIEYNYIRRVAAVSDGLQFAVQWSDTLAANDWHTTGVTQAVLSDNGSWQQVKAVIPASGEKKFVRLSVTTP